MSPSWILPCWAPAKCLPTEKQEVQGQGLGAAPFLQMEVSNFPQPAQTWWGGGFCRVKWNHIRAIRHRSLRPLGEGREHPFSLEVWIMASGLSSWSLPSLP